MGRKGLVYGILHFLPLLIVAKIDDKSSGNCIDFHLSLVEDATLKENQDFRDYSKFAEKNIGDLRPFGSEKADWTRLRLLHDALPKDSPLKDKFDRLYGLLLIAHDEASLLEKSSGSVENSTKRVTLLSEKYDFNKNLSRDDIFEKVKSSVSNLRTEAGVNSQTSSEVSKFNASPYKVTQAIPSSKNTSEINVYSSILFAEKATEKYDFNKNLSRHDIFENVKSTISNLGTEAIPSSKNTSEINVYSSILLAEKATEKYDFDKNLGRDDIFENVKSSISNLGTEAIPSSKNTSEINVYSSILFAEKTTEKYDFDKNLGRDDIFENVKSSISNLGTEAIPSSKNTSEINVYSSILFAEKTTEKYDFNKNLSRDDIFENLKSSLNMKEDPLTKSAIYPTSILTENPLIQTLIEKSSSKSFFHTPKPQSETEISTKRTKEEERSTFSYRDENSSAVTFASDKSAEIPSPITTRGDEKVPQVTEKSSQLATTENRKKLNPAAISSEEYSSRPTKTSKKPQISEFSTLTLWKSMKKQQSSSSGTQTQSTLTNDEYFSGFTDGASILDSAAMEKIFENDRSRHNESKVFPDNIEDSTLRMIDGSKETEAIEKRLKTNEIFPAKLNDEISTITKKVPMNFFDFSQRAKTTENSDAKNDVWKTSTSSNLPNMEDIVGKNAEKSTTEVDEKFSNVASARTTIKFNIAKNTLRFDQSMKNGIFRHYKHGVDVERNASKIGENVVYELNIDERNKSIWRQGLKEEMTRDEDIRRLGAFEKSFKATNPFSGRNNNEESSKTGETSVNDSAKINETKKSSLRAPIHKLKTDEKGSSDGNIEKRLLWFYRQGQPEVLGKSRGKGDEDAKIKLQCGNSRRQ